MLKPKFLHFDLHARITALEFRSVKHLASPDEISEITECVLLIIAAMLWYGRGT